MYSVHKIEKWDVLKLFRVADILYQCGKHMSVEYNLHHWDNSYVKCLMIVFLHMLKNNVYLVYYEEHPIATFQIIQINQVILFQKLAVSPDFSGKGIGSYCLRYIEQLAAAKQCSEINRGYHDCEIVKSVKYRLLRLKKEL